MAFRIDTFKIDGKPARTKEGFLRVDAIVTRSGVFRYRNLDGSERLELRSDSEVFNPKCINSLKMIPVTNDHPITGIVTADNAKSLQVGFSGQDVKIEKPYIKVPLVITDKKTIEDIENGKREISCGYFCNVNEKKGVYNGEPHTHEQTNIENNHIAIVDCGRAGHNVKLQLDSLHIDGKDQDIAIMVTDSNIEDKKGLRIDNNDNNNNPLSKKGKKMPTKRINNIDYEGAPELINHCDALEKRVDELNKKLAATEAERDTHKSRADKAEAEVAKLPNKLADALAARRTLEVQASTVLPKNTKFDSMSDDQIRTAVIAAKYPDINLDGKGADYISAVFDLAIASKPTANASHINTMLMNDKVDNFNRNDAEDFDPLSIQRRC